MEFVETEGSSIDDAIERALQQLGVARDKVDVEIIANATKGLFGIGGKKAKVRATIRGSISLDGDPGRPADPPKAAKKPAAAPAESPSKSDAAKGADSAEKDTAKAAAARRDEDRSQARPRRARNERSRRPRREPAERPEVEVSAETLEATREVLEQTVRLIGTEASVSISRDNLGVCLQIDGDESGILIGRRGQTLDALEYMINRVASRDTGHTTRIVVDSHGYRQRRRESLEAMARRMGDRATERGKTVTMNPMSPRDRRIVHLALQDNPGLETRSSGKGYFRKLLIIPERR